LIEIKKPEKWSINCSQRPKDTEINLVVLHYTAGDFDSSLSWLMNPASKVSAHYLISRLGDIWQLVPEEWKAWHAGRSSWNGQDNVNEFSIGIELVGWRMGGFTDLQLTSLLWLSKDIMIRHSNINPSLFTGHSNIAPGRKVDPDGTEGQFPWDLFRRSLRCKCLN